MSPEHPTILTPERLPQITVRLTDWADPIGAALRARLMDEIRADVEGETDVSHIPSASDIQVVVLLEVAGEAIACAGLRAIKPASSSSSAPPSADAASSSSPRGPDSFSAARADEAEVKRMFVVPEFRGAKVGVTARLMAEVEREAARRGFGVLRLATGDKMVRARKFYERHGFVETALFGPYVTTSATICYAKELK